MRGQYAILLLQCHRWGIKVDIRYHNYIIQCGSIPDSAMEGRIRGWGSSLSWKCQDFESFWLPAQVDKDLWGVGLEALLGKHCQILQKMFWHGADLPLLAMPAFWENWTCNPSLDAVWWLISCNNMTIWVLHPFARMVILKLPETNKNSATTDWNQH